VIKLTDPIRDVAHHPLASHGLSRVIEQSKDVTERPTDRVTIEELLRVNNGHGRPQHPVAFARTGSKPEPELNVEELKNASTLFDPTHPMWLIQKGIVKRFCRVYGDRT